MIKNPLHSDVELMQLYCSKTGLSQSLYHEMIKTYDQISDTLKKFNDLLQRLRSSKQSRHQRLAQREYQTICNMMQGFETKFKIRCIDSVHDAITDYKPPPESI
jgi:DNA-binding protein H-NS